MKISVTDKGLVESYATLGGLVGTVYEVAEYNLPKNFLSEFRPYKFMYDPQKSPDVQPNPDYKEPTHVDEDPVLPPSSEMAEQLEEVKNSVTILTSTVEEQAKQLAQAEELIRKQSELINKLLQG